jgi:inhibitor of KinA sporulation pathway (predicted exonuclease)
MTMFHAVVWLDHHKAQVLQFDAEHVQASKVKAHTHHTAQHGSAVRSVHEFHAHVCDALKDIPEVLVTGSKTSLSDFRHYVEKHRPQLAPHIAGWEAVDHPSDRQLVALARQYFLRHDRMSGVPTPT